MFSWKILITRLRLFEVLIEVISIPELLYDSKTKWHICIPVL
jgi:hypothetical protein